MPDSFREMIEGNKLMGYARGHELVRKGDRVRIHNARKYDAMAPDKVEGTVYAIWDDGSIAVTVGTGSYNARPEDVEKL